MKVAAFLNKPLNRSHNKLFNGIEEKKNSYSRNTFFNPGSLKIRAFKYISATPLLRTLLQVSGQFQSEMSREWR